jgi:hypothetical protein
MRKPFAFRKKTLLLGILIVHTGQSSLPMHPSVNKIVCWDALQIHSHTHPSLLIPSSAFGGKNPKAMDKGKQPQEDGAPKKRTIRG